MMFVRMHRAEKEGRSLHRASTTVGEVQTGGGTRGMHYIKGDDTDNSGATGESSTSAEVTASNTHDAIEQIEMNKQSNENDAAPAPTSEFDTRGGFL